MAKVLRITELEPKTREAKHPRLGVNGSVEVFVLEDDLVNGLMRFVEQGEFDSAHLRAELIEILHWQQALFSRRRGGTFQASTEQDMGIDVRRVLAAQYLRMRRQAAKLEQAQGYETIPDYEICWCVT